MERAKQVAHDGELTVRQHAILPPPAFTMPPPAPLEGRAPAAKSAEHAAATRQFEAAKTLQATKEAAYREARATVEQARELERKTHDKLRAALAAKTNEIKGLGQFRQWSQAAASATIPAAAGLMKLAAEFETKSVEATRAVFEKAAGHSPYATHSMWAALTPEQRADLIARYPQMVGSTNGIPTAERDDANRLILNAQRQNLLNRLNEERSRLREDPTHRRSVSDYGTAGRIDELEEALSGIDNLERKLGLSAKESGYYLLEIDSTADSRGRAIISAGNPDNANHVLTFVPGTLADLGTAPSDVASTDAILNRARELAPEQEIAGITWCDYQTPPSLDSAMDGNYASSAGQGLKEFQAGLRATHSPDLPRGHNTVLGHSYGTTTIGYTARDHGLDADDIAFLGSPGVGVERAHELGTDPAHVWSGTSGNDEIAAADWNLGLIDPIDGQENQWFGLSPSEPNFGGQSIPTAPDGTHVDYWKHRESVDGVARVVNGTAKGAGTG